jgi:hypothetical protein
MTLFLTVTSSITCRLSLTTFGDQCLSKMAASHGVDRSWHTIRICIFKAIQWCDTSRHAMACTLCCSRLLNAASWCCAGLQGLGELHTASLRIICLDVITGQQVLTPLMCPKNHQANLTGRCHMQATQLVKGLLNQVNIIYDTVPIHTVTAKEEAPTKAAGDKRFYWSIGPYFWPQEKTPQNPRGEPYIRRDGEFNAEVCCSCP